MNPESDPPLSVVQTSGIERHRRSGLTIVREPGQKKFTCRIRFRKKVHHLTLSETARDSLDIALRARREIQASRWQEYRAATALRYVSEAKLHQLFAVYRRFTGPDRPAPSTLELNINSLTAILIETLDSRVDVGQLPLSQLSRELIWQWKEKKRACALVDGTTDERARQILRSANSRLRQARSLFAKNEDLRTFYRFHHLDLPDSIVGFCSEPPFADCSKDDYHAPTDHVVAATFAALEQLGRSQNPDDINMFKACWLALGFGLRAGDMRQARNFWFEKINGVVFIRGDKLAKNRKFPEVRVQLGAWTRLAPFIESLGPGIHGPVHPQAFVLHGSPTERGDTVFRRISEWMRSLGWQTTHHVHELRAWAGCQIVMAAGGRGLLDAQVFMRHAHYSTTEKFYGHHIKIQLGEVELKLPSPTQNTFKPVLLPAVSA